METQRELSATILSTPCGELTLVADGEGLVAVLWEQEGVGRSGFGRRVPLGGRVGPANPISQRAARQLEEYFAGERRSFDLPLKMVGTEFQCKVWRALQSIPYGETRSYSWLAEQVGSPRAVRAVGAANGRNPLSIVVPCHRVVGKNGHLTGFAGGLTAKSVLLELETQKQS